MFGRDIKYVLNVCPCLLYVIFRFCKCIVKMLRFRVTCYAVQYCSLLFVSLVNIIKIWGRFTANAFFYSNDPE